MGDLDRVFALAAERPPPPEAWFAPAMAPLRADPRFMPLMRDLGLLRFWNLNDRWPDFCSDPNLPYRCQTEALRLT
jgi:hypothetical protein